MISILPRAWAALSLTVLLTAGAAYAQVIPVNSTYKGLFASSDPTMTFLFEAAEAKATLVFVPGGEGHRGIKLDWKANHPYFSSYYFNVMLRSLSDATVTSGQFNVVIFDSPEALLTRRGWSEARASTYHLSRVEDVVRHYKERFGKPVWVMGHSNGSISVTELYKRLQDSNSDGLIAGLTVSGGVNGISFNYASTKLPVLVLHHENDECVSTPPSNARGIYTRLIEAGNAAAELILVKSSKPSTGDPCRSGNHMYFGAGHDVARVLDQFMNKHLRSP